MALLLLCPPATAAAEDDERYHKVEAAFLYNFFNYITWPDYAAPQELHQPRICIYHNDPIEPYLAYVQRKISTERQLTIRAINEGDDVADCNLLFSRHRLAQDTMPRATLIVTELADTLDRGEGMIELERSGDGIQMRIDQQTLAEKGFHVSSRLLDLAVK